MNKNWNVIKGLISRKKELEKKVSDIDSEKEDIKEKKESCEERILSLSADIDDIKGVISEYKHEKFKAIMQMCLSIILEYAVLFTGVNILSGFGIHDGLNFRLFMLGTILFAIIDVHEWQKTMGPKKKKLYPDGFSNVKEEITELEKELSYEREKSFNLSKRSRILSMLKMDTIDLMDDCDDVIIDLLTYEEGPVTIKKPMIEQEEVVTDELEFQLIRNR